METVQGNLRVVIYIYIYTYIPYSTPYRTFAQLLLVVIRLAAFVFFCMLQPLACIRSGEVFPKYARLAQLSSQK